jgi:hypothetical protein
MKYPPSSFAQWLEAGNTLKIVNGRPTYAEDAQLIDTYATYLACEKPPAPSSLGRPFYSGHTWYQRQRLQPYSRQMIVSFLCNGAGSITCTVDGNAQTFDVNNGSGAANSLESATWVQAPDLYALSSVSTRSTVDWNFSITDKSGAATLAVYTVRPYVIRPSAAEPL